MYAFPITPPTFDSSFSILFFAWFILTWSFFIPHSFIIFHYTRARAHTHTYIYIQFFKHIFHLYYFFYLAFSIVHLSRIMLN